MKRILTFLTISVLFVSFSMAQTLEENERELFKKHKVQERAKFDYKFSGDKVSDKGVKSSVSTYNTMGLVLTTISYNPKGEEVTTEKFGYDNNGNRTQYERKSMTGAYKKNSQYDEEDNVILESGYDGSAAFKTTYKYNSNNKVTEIGYYVENLLDEKRVYEYVGQTAVVKILHKGKDLKSTVKLKFNSNGDILEETVFSLEGTELEKRLVEYNAQGLITKEEKYRGGEKSYTIWYYYDAHNNLVKITEDSKSKGRYDKKLYKYDSQNRVTEYKWTRKPDQDYNIKTYTYGADGVCTEEQTFYPKTNYKMLSKYEYKFF